MTIGIKIKTHFYADFRVTGIFNRHFKIFIGRAISRNICLYHVIARTSAIAIIIKRNLITVDSKQIGIIRSTKCSDELSGRCAAARTSGIITRISTSIISTSITSRESEFNGKSSGCRRSDKIHFDCSNRGYTFCTEIIIFRENSFPSRRLPCRKFKIRITVTISFICHQFILRHKRCTRVIRNFNTHFGSFGIGPIRQLPLNALIITFRRCFFYTYGISRNCKRIITCSPSDRSHRSRFIFRSGGRTSLVGITLIVTTGNIRIVTTGFALVIRIIGIYRIKSRTFTF